MNRSRIVYRLLLFVLPLLFASILITSSVLTWTSYNHFQKTIRTDYRNILRSSAGEINLFVESAQDGLEGLAWVVAATKLDQWQKEMALAAFNHTATEFISVSLVSMQGEEIVATGWEKDDGRLSRDETFRTAASGQSAISGVMLTDQNIPYVHMAVPVRELEEVGAVLWAKLNLKSVWDVLEGIKVGETGRVSIMDLSGRLIGHLEMDRVVRAIPAERPEELAKLDQTHEPVEWVEEKKGAKLYCLAYRVPGLDWVVVLTQAHSEIYAYLHQSIYWAAVVTGVICIAAILIGWNRVRRFLVPIHDLHGQVQRIGKGDLDYKVSVGSQDEIGELALAFNEMTDALKRYIDREVETAKELVHAKNLAILGSTSSKVTHEVGNLLNNVGLTVSILGNETLSKGGREALAILEKDAVRVKSFIQDFLQFAKKPDLYLERASIEEIVQEVFFVQRAEGQKRGIHFELEWPSHVPPVLVDKSLIYQVFNNLVKNSLEAIAGSGEIAIEGSTNQHYLVVRIKDTGQGMGPDIAEHIFEPFYTTKGKKGTGLGLSVVKSIVEAHRGAIACESAPGEGTVFVLQLPLQ